MKFLKGDVISNRYQIDTLLGEGGFGAVYRVYDPVDGVHRVLKHNMDMSTEGVEQFKREAEFMRQLDHPSIPRVHNAFYAPGFGQGIVTDEIVGADIEDVINRRGPLSPTEALPIVEQIGEALEYAHKHGVIHRDIKPANIMVTPDGRPFLVDFGLAKAIGTKTTKGARAVTPGYAPVEQYGRGTTDARSDIYAFGATLYTMITGKEPDESVHRIGHETIQLPPNTPPHVVSAVEKAMRVDPNMRHATVEQFVNHVIPPPTPHPLPSTKRTQMQEYGLTDSDICWHMGNGQQLVGDAAIQAANVQCVGGGTATGIDAIAYVKRYDGYGYGWSG